MVVVVPQFAPRLRKPKVWMVLAAAHSLEVAPTTRSTAAGSAVMPVSVLVGHTVYTLRPTTLLL